MLLHRLSCGGEILRRAADDFLKKRRWNEQVATTRNGDDPRADHHRAAVVQDTAGALPHLQNFADGAETSSCVLRLGAMEMPAASIVIFVIFVCAHTTHWMCGGGCDSFSGGRISECGDFIRFLFLNFQHFLLHG